MIDAGVLGTTPAETEFRMRKVASDLTILGFSIQFKKCISFDSVSGRILPVQRLVHLGLGIDLSLGIFFLPLVKIERVRVLVKRILTSLRACPQEIATRLGFGPVV